MISATELQAQLKHTIAETNFTYLGEKYAGKVRDNYTYDDKRILVATDKLSAFDHNITTIPFKGQLLTQMANFWFDATSHIVKNHKIDSPDPNVLIAEPCTPLKIEMVVRGYMTGTTSTSIWHYYEKGERNIYGIEFPDGLTKNCKLPQPIITPTTKAAHGHHDEKILREEIIDQGLLSAEDYDYVAKKSLELFAYATELCEKHGIIMVDTKYEFGKNSKGEIILIDEIHTPDSSRFWLTETYNQKIAAGEEPDNINKEFLRLWLAKAGYKGDGPPPEIPTEIRTETASRYITAYEKVTNLQFSGTVGDVIARIDQNLKSYFKI